MPFNSYIDPDRHLSALLMRNYKKIYLYIYINKVNIDHETHGAHQRT